MASSPLASYTATTSEPASPPSKTWKPTTNSIHYHHSLASSSDSSAARIYTMSQTAFLMSYYILRFKLLVADPVRTMIEMLIPLVIAQGAWCVVCLPRSGHWDARIKGLKIDETGSPAETKATAAVGNGKGSVRRKGGIGIGGPGAGGQSKGDGFASRIAPLIISLLLTVTTLPPPLIALSVLLGAPATTHTAQTGLLAVHVALLIGPPLFYTHGVSNQAWREILSLFLPFDEAGVWGGVIGALVGGWLGAVPIPLDWDREWQKWPVTVLTGIWIGWALGRSLLGPVLLKSKRIDLREVDAQDFEDRTKLANDKTAAGGGEVAKQKNRR